MTQQFYDLVAGGYELHFQAHDLAEMAMNELLWTRSINWNPYQSATGNNLRWKEQGQ